MMFHHLPTKWLTKDQNIKFYTRLIPRQPEKCRNQPTCSRATQKCKQPHKLSPTNLQAPLRLDQTWVHSASRPFTAGGGGPSRRTVSTSPSSTGSWITGMPWKIGPWAWYCCQAWSIAPAKEATRLGSTKSFPGICRDGPGSGNGSPWLRDCFQVRVDGPLPIYNFARA